MEDHVHDAAGGTLGGDDAADARTGGDEKVDGLGSGDEKVGGLADGEERVGGLAGGEERVGGLAGGEERVGRPADGDERVDRLVSGDERVSGPAGGEDRAGDGRSSPRRGFSGGVRVGLGLAVPTALLALTFGAMTRDLGWGVLAPVVASAVVFSGSAQFALATAIGGGGGLVAAVASAALINARFAPMGVAIAPSLRGNRLRRAIEGQAVVDGSFVAAHQGGGHFDRELLIGATAVQYVAWVLGTLAGALLAPPPHLSHALGLDVVFPAFFLLLLLDEIGHSRRAKAAAGLGGVIAAGLVAALPAGAALLGSSLGALVGLRRRQRDDGPQPWTPDSGAPPT